ncbi:MAG: hypothetical protein SFW07_08060 [Gammaproteobacteria bacterium]|nr:hypothetical protein [Gammaproteobacteria bacterium]
MKLKLGLILLCAGFLSSCATMGGPQRSITQETDQSQLNLAFNTAKDGTMQKWEGSNGNEYHLLTSNTHVNYQGVPCRHFSLDVIKSFYRGESLSGTACRYDGKWTDIPENNA